MVSCNTALQMLDTCHFIRVLRDAHTTEVMPGLELPDSLKTDRGEPDIEPLMRKGMKDCEKLFNLKEEVEKMRKEFVAQGLVKKPRISHSSSDAWYFWCCVTFCNKKDSSI